MTTREKILERISQDNLGFDQLSDEEKNLFADRSEFEDHQKILSATKGWITPSGISQEEAWNNIEDRILLETGSNQKLRWLSIAAVISFLIIVTYTLLPKEEVMVIASELTEIKQIELPDGSIVTLNPLSSIEYDLNWADKRAVSLKGKARFDVKRGSSFAVSTDQYVTTVLGTSFDVSYENRELEVSCYSGSVRVEGQTQSYVIEPGEQLIVSGNDFIKQQFDTKQISRWVEGEFYFDNVPLSEVIMELERQFGLQVRGGDRDRRLYKGYFYKDNINRALELVFKPMGYDYTLENQVVTIK